MPSRPWSRRLLAVVLVWIGLPLGLNALAFLWELAEYGTWWSGDRPAGLYVERPGRLPALRPGARLRGLRYQVSINGQGFRGPELTAPWPPEGLRLWAMGGSTTFDIYAPEDGQTWPALLQAELAGALPGRPVEVINAGVPGQTLRGSLDDLLERGRGLDLDGVVVYHCANDLRELFATSYTRGAPPPPPPRGGLGPPDVALVRVLGRARQAGGEVVLQGAPRELTAEHVRDLDGRLRAVVSAVRAEGWVPVLATHALRAPPDATGAQAREGVGESALFMQTTPERVLEAFATCNALVAALAEEQGLPLADVRAAVGPEPEHWGDSTHFLPAGSARAAQAIAQAVLQSGLVR